MTGREWKAPPSCVVLESPYGALTQEGIDLNMEYARRCLKDSLDRGEAPFASHLLYTQVLDDDVPGEREAGIDGQLAWIDLAQRIVVYVDLGISPGMRKAIDYASELRHQYRIEYRSLDGKAIQP